ncbi:MAG: family 43 glycosylhydrolase, partial [Sphingomonas sp.]|nr:family 43 glycosylhydrolase [Sphingomonas sp.]
MRDSLDSAANAFDGAGGSPTTAAETSQHLYQNPVLDCDFPDPAIVHADDGYYYVYGTQSLRGGRWINIQVARSKDLVHWDYLGDALPEKPEWAQTTQDFWAPSVIFDGSTYFMYYSAT